MSDVTFATAQRVATLLAGGIKGRFLYPAAHPSNAQLLRELANLLAEITRSEASLAVGVVEGVMVVGDHLFVNPTAPVADLADNLAEKEITAIVFERGVNQDDLAVLVSLLAVRRHDVAAVNAGLAAEAVQTISVCGADLQAPPVEDDEEPPFEASAAYGQALNAVKQVWREIEQGRIPSSSEVVEVVDMMVDISTQDPATLFGLAMIKDYDNYTFHHSVNVGILALALAASLGLPREVLRETGIAGLLHDIGKTRIDKTILNKPGKLAPPELALMRSHPEEGAKIVKEMEGIPPAVSQAVLGHHIRFNRTGYPEWARKLPFDLMCEIIAVADTYDAATTLRSYQRPLTPKGALDIIRKLSGRDLNAKLVEKFVELMGSYPVGTLVRLDTGELAVVYRPNAGAADAPTVKIIADRNGKLLEREIIENLADRPDGGKGRIVSALDPVSKNIDVSRYLA